MDVFFVVVVNEIVEFFKWFCDFVVLRIINGCLGSYICCRKIYIKMLVVFVLEKLDCEFVFEFL